MNRFFITDKNIINGNIIIDDYDSVKHMYGSLRLKPGESVMFSDNVHWEYMAEVKEVNKNKVVLRILDKQRFSREPEIQITLFQSLPKQDKMEIVIKKSVELGVKEIIPVYTDRTLVPKNKNPDAKIKRWNKISEEAAKQCGRGLIPYIHEPVEKKEIRFDDFDLVLLPYEEESKITIKQILRNCKSNIKNIAAIIGPEGGFSKEETDFFMAKGARSVTLGKTVLRTETAGPITVAMIMYELEL